MFFKFRIANFSLLIINITLYSFLSAGPPDTLWTRTYGGDSEDVGYSVQQASDGGFFVVGYTESFGAGGNDVYLIRVNSDGDTVWTKTYGGNSDDEGRSVRIMSDGGLIITGFTGSFGAGDLDVYLIRTDANGDTLWTKTYGGNEMDYGNSIQITKDGGFIIAAETQSFHSGDSYWVGDLYLIRTDANGDTLWTKLYRKNSLNTVDNEVQQTSDGGFIVIGCTNLSGAGDDDYYVLRTDVNGDSLWAKTYGGTHADIGYSIQQMSDGGFVLTGVSYSFGAGKTDVYLVRTTSNGDTVLTKTYGGYNHDNCNSMQKTSDGGFVIAGSSSSFSDSRDAYIIRTDANGDTLWTKTCDGAYENDNEESYEIQQTNDGGFIIVGKLDVPLERINDVYLIRLDKETTGIQYENPNFFFKPNDFIFSYDQRNISIRYTTPYSTNVKLEAFDIKGKLVKVITDKFMNKGSYSVNWDSKRFGAGVYFLRLSVNGSSVSRKVTVIQ